MHETRDADGDARSTEARVFALEQLIRLRARWAPLWALVCVALLLPLALEPWRWVVVGVVATVLLGLFFLDRARGAKAVVASLHERYAPLVLSGHALVVAATGGLRSPLLPVFVPLLVFLGASSLGGAHRAVGPIVATAWILALLLAEVLGLLPLPRALGAAHPALLSAIAFVMASVLWGASLVASASTRAQERVAAELSQARQALVDAQAERLRALEGLVDRVAHEIRNPLTAVRGLVQLMQASGPGGPSAEHLAVIDSEAARLGTIVDDLAARSGSIEVLREERVQLPALIEEVARLLEARAAEARVALVHTCEPGLAVRGDPVRLRQVLLNLLVNALESVEALPPGRPRTVRVEAARSGAGVEIVVRDSGPGGATEVERLFDPYVSTKARGSGLGLPISRAIARAHGGELSLGFPPGGGATATVTLPEAA